METKDPKEGRNGKEGPLFGNEKERKGGNWKGRGNELPNTEETKAPF